MKKVDKLITKKKISELKEGLKEGEALGVIPEKKEEREEEDEKEDVFTIVEGEGEGGGAGGSVNSDVSMERGETRNIAPIKTGVSAAGSESGMTLRSGREVAYKSKGTRGTAAEKMRSTTKSKRVRGVTFAKKTEKEEEKEESKRPVTRKKKKAK